MIPRQMTTSAALFFDAEQFNYVPLSWLERVQRLFVERNLVPVLFTAGGGDFQLDDCYILADSGSEIFLWGERISARGSELTNSLRAGVVSNLQLDSPRCRSTQRDDARLVASLSSTGGMFYVGADDDLVPSPADLLRCVCEIAQGLINFRYGFAFRRSLHQHPASYAAGQRSFSVAEAFEFIRRRKDWERRAKTADELWHDELMGQKRHLTGLFRDAYPANVLSEAHLTNAALRTSGVGKLMDLGGCLWLWELTEREVHTARKMLKDRGLLVAPKQ
jgi:hypothetical protein